MYTQCPHCQTIFGVSEAHLSAAFGRVRCGHCHSQFNAKRHLLDEIPAQAEANPAIESPVEELPTEPTDIHHHKTDTGSVLELEPLDIELAPQEDMPEDEIDHIDLSGTAEHPSDETRHEVIIDLNEYNTGDHELPVNDLNLTSAEIDSIDLPELEEDASRAEMNAIFADLDEQLEKLSENTSEAVIKPHEEFELSDTDNSNFDDAFGDPDSQTEDDIKASIETIFAAAEAELIKTESLDENEQNSTGGQEIYLNEFLDESVEISQPELKLEADEPGDNVTVPDEADSDVPHGFELVTPDHSEIDISLIKQDEHIVAEPEQAPDPLPDFTQEELPFSLHEAEHSEPAAKRSGLMAVILSSTILLLCLAALFQLALFRNIELANNFPALKPWLVKFCEHIPCQFSGKRDVKKIFLTSRDVRSHPEGKNTILINAIFVNRAEFEQPFPEIVITLSDLTTTVVSQRRFSPSEYLNQSQGVFQLMKPGKPVHISLEVLDPGNDAVNFQFDFL